MNTIDIDPSEVTDVLLADGWHKVVPNRSTGEGSFEVGDTLISRPDQFIAASEQLSYTFLTVIKGQRCCLTGPATAIIALRTDAWDKDV